VVWLVRLSVDTHRGSRVEPKWLLLLLLLLVVVLVLLLLVLVLVLLLVRGRGRGQGDRGRGRDRGRPEAEGGFTCGVASWAVCLDFWMVCDGM